MISCRLSFARRLIIIVLLLGNALGGRAFIAVGAGVAGLLG